jgi:hypothetical protein
MKTMNATQRFGSCCGVALGASLACFARAQVHAVDVILQVQSGGIVTGRVDDGVTDSPRYVFQGTLGDTGVPGGTANPGFDSENGTFAAQQIVGITIRKALRVWNGNGFSLIAGSPTPVTTMQLVRNSTTLTTPNVDPPPGSFGADLTLGQANSVGRLHQHPAYLLQGGTSAGIYMLELQVWMGDDATGVSAPICVLFNQNAEQTDVDAAFAWAEANFHTPPPPVCDANCDGSTGTPALTASDFTCFLAKFRSGDSYANCDGSTGTPLLTAADFTCFLAKFRSGCS